MSRTVGPSTITVTRLISDCRPAGMIHIRTSKISRISPQFVRYQTPLTVATDYIGSSRLAHRLGGALVLLRLIPHLRLVAPGGQAGSPRLRPPGRHVNILQGMSRVASVIVSLARHRRHGRRVKRRAGARPPSLSMVRWADVSQGTMSRWLHRPLAAQAADIPVDRCQLLLRPDTRTVSIARGVPAPKPPHSLFTSRRRAALQVAGRRHSRLGAWPCIRLHSALGSVS